MHTRSTVVLRRLGMAAALLALASAPALGQAALAPVAPVEVKLNLPPSQAFDRVMAAFAASGLTPDQASRDAGTIRSVPVPQATEHGITAELIFRVTILPADSGSRVLVTASGHGTLMMHGQMTTTPEVPLSECPEHGHSHDQCVATLTAYKAKIQALADRIRAGS